MQRREFVKGAMLAGLAWSTGLNFNCTVKRAGALKILVLGGTRFVGPAIVKNFMDAGHQITLFNRGISDPDLFPKLTLVKGDRKTGPSAYTPLLKEQWDIVIDVWPEDSRLVDQATNALQHKANHYVFISSIAVYADFQIVGLKEDSSLVTTEGDKKEWGYAEEKVAAENLVRQRFPDRHTILRPGAIKGWRDPSLDLLYWCIRLQTEEAILAPGSGMDPLQFIDVEDVGKFVNLAAENKLVGTYNVLGPRSQPLLWKDFLVLVKRHFNVQTELNWAKEEFLKEHQVYSFSDLPLWAPLSEDRGFMQISNEKLLATDFQFTEISATLDACWKWNKRTMKKEIEFGTAKIGIGLSRDRELDLIAKMRG